MIAAMKRRATRSLVLFLALAAWTVSGGAGAASAEDTRACELVSLHRVETTVHLPKAQVLRDTSSLDGTENLQPGEGPGVVDTECDLGLWSGAKPKNLAAVFEKARAGQGAQVGVETWSPNDASLNAEDWIKTGWQEETDNFIKARWALVFNSGGKNRPLHPKGEGYIGAGATMKVTGKGKGLEAAIGCWWDHPSYRIVCIFDEEDEGKPIVDHLNTLAENIVPKSLGAP
jgi:hypothetical protein